MAKITDEMKEIVENAKVFVVATATKKGEPNVVPIAYGKVLSDDEILLMDIFMKKTVENIKANPKVAVSVWATGDSKGYQFKGDARIETAGKVFDDSVKWVKNTEPQLSPKAAVVVKVDSVYVTSPGPDAGKRIS